MKILYITNIPSPYRIDYFNLLGKEIDLTVVFEARRVSSTTFDWNDNQLFSFRSIFLSEDIIKEKQINFRILHYIKKNKYDYLIFTNYAYATETFALLLAKVFKIPYILEIDGGLIKKECKLKYLIKKFFISNASLYLSPGKLGDSYLIHYGAAPELIKRYPFSSLKKSDILIESPNMESKNILKKELELNFNKIILMVGQFIPRKGVDILLKAAKEMPSDIGICIIGGKINNEYIRIIEANNIKNVLFLEFMSKTILTKYYLAADIFVLPTREDVWGLVINEAMSKGLPIITTLNCGAGLELIKDNGVLIPVNDSKLLICTIKKILTDDQLLKDMSEASIREIQNYTIENMVERHLDIFKKAIENNHAIIKDLKG